MPALYSFVVIRLCHTPLGVGRLVCHHERTRLTSMTINRAIIVDCKSIKKLSIKSQFEMEKFVQILILTQNNPIFTLISIVLCHGTLTYRQKSKKNRYKCYNCQYGVPQYLGHYLLFSSLIGFQKFTSCFQRISTWGVVI